MPKIIFFDTTLRDGEQTPGMHLGAARKLDIARRLEALGVDVIEAGFPAASAAEAAAVESIAREIKGSSVCALARASRADIDAAWNAIKDAARPRIHTFIAVSDLHIEYKLKMTRAEVLGKIRDAVSYAKSLCSDVEFSGEDATRADRDFLCDAMKAAKDAGATTLNIPDTVGYITPAEFTELLNYVKEKIGGFDGVTLSVHCHNDLGLAVANSLAAISAGATQIECTVNGLGERAGNAALEEVAMALHTRRDFFGFDSNIDTTEITRTSRQVVSLTGIPISPGKAIVGKNAFLHESGIHQHGVMCNRATYEIMTPESVGLNRASMPLGKLSGRHALAEKISSFGYKFDDEAIGVIFAKFKEFAAKKPEITDEDVHALVEDYLDSLTSIYKLDSFQIQSGNMVKAMAMISLLRVADGEVISEAALGSGPIDAAFNAIDRIVGGEGRLALIGYNIKAVTEGTDALGEVYVRIRADGGIYNGRGVSSDIIKASIKAYVNAVNKWLSVSEGTTTG